MEPVLSPRPPKTSLLMADNPQRKRQRSIVLYRYFHSNEMTAFSHSPLRKESQPLKKTISQRITRFPSRFTAKPLFPGPAGPSQQHISSRCRRPPPNTRPDGPIAWYPSSNVALSRSRLATRETHPETPWLTYQEKKPWNPRFHGFDAIAALT